MILILTRKQVTRAVILILSILFILYVGYNMSDMVIHNAMSNDGKYEGDWSEHFAQFEPAKNGYSVLVDLDSMILFLYKDAVEIKSWPVSGGSKENPSPVGNWEVSDIGDWGGAFGGSWIALNIPWGKYGIHGTVESWAIGEDNISHGCIRMNNEDAAELKEYMSVGVPVHIKHDNAPFRVLKDGHIGSDVLLLQIMLEQLGYYDSKPNGIFGEETFEAVCQFQADESVTVDGIVGRESWDRLQKYVL